MAQGQTHGVSASTRLLGETRVEDVMNRGVLSCPLETSLSAVAEMMATHKVHCIVGFGDVTEDDTQIWGVVSDLDLIKVAAHEAWKERRPAALLRRRLSPLPRSAAFARRRSS